MTTSIASGIVSLRSPYSFADTVQRLLSAFANHGLKVFAAIDQKAEAAAVALTMPPTTLLLFGNPKAGTPIMLTQPLAALAAPGEVIVSFNAAAYILQRHSLPDELSTNLAPAESVIAGAIAG